MLSYTISLEGSGMSGDNIPSSKVVLEFSSAMLDTITPASSGGSGEATKALPCC